MMGTEAEESCFLESSRNDDSVEAFLPLDDISEALEQVFPSFDMAIADAKFQANSVAIDRLCQELYARLQPNALRICYDPPFVAFNAGDVIWGDESCEIFLPIRQPIGSTSSAPQMNFQTSDNGSVVVRIQEAERPIKRQKVNKKDQTGKFKPPVHKQKMKAGNKTNKDPKHKDKKKKALPVEKDPLDSLKSSDGQYMASCAALKATLRLLKLGMQQLISDFKDQIDVRRLKLDRRCGTIRATVEVQPEFICTDEHSSASNSTVDLRQKYGSNKEAVVTNKSGIFGLSVEPTTEDGDARNDIQVDLNPDQDAQPDNEPMVPRLLELRITPVLRLPGDDDLQAFAAPSAAAGKQAGIPDAWILRHPIDEAVVLTSLARADRGVRLRVWRGVVELCQQEAGPLSDCLGERKLLMHCLMDLSDSEVDSGDQRLWQQASCGDYTRDLLGYLRDCLTDGRLPHYFNRELNLLGHLELRECRAAAAKLDFYLRKPTALVRAVQRTSALPPESQKVAGSPVDNIKLRQ